MLNVIDYIAKTLKTDDYKNIIYHSFLVDIPLLRGKATMKNSLYLNIPAYLLDYTTFDNPKVFLTLENVYVDPLSEFSKSNDYFCSWVDGGKVKLKKINFGLSGFIGYESKSLSEDIWTFLFILSFIDEINNQVFIKLTFAERIGLDNRSNNNQFK